MREFVLGVSRNNRLFNSLEPARNETLDRRKLYNDVIVSFLVESWVFCLTCNMILCINNMLYDASKEDEHTRDYYSHGRLQG